MNKQRYEDEITKQNKQYESLTFYCLLGAFLCFMVAIICISALFNARKDTNKKASAQTNEIQQGHLYSIDAKYFFDYTFSSTSYFLSANYFYGWTPFTLAEVDENTTSYMGGLPSPTANGFQISAGNYLYLGYNDNVSNPRRWVQLTANNTTITERIETYNGSYQTTNLQHNRSTAKLYFYARDYDFGMTTLNGANQQSYVSAFLNTFRQYAVDEGALSQTPQIESGFAFSGEFIAPNHGNFNQILQITNSEPLTEYALNTITCTNPTNQISVMFLIQCLTTADTLQDTILTVPVYDGVCRFFIVAPETTRTINIRFYGETTATILSQDIVNGAIANGKLLLGNVYSQYKAYGEEIGAQNAQQNNLVNLIFATMDAPIKILFGTYDNSTHLWTGGLFSFTVLGVDIRAFAAGLLSFCLIIAIVKLVMGMRR